MEERPYFFLLIRTALLAILLFFSFCFLQILYQLFYPSGQYSIAMGFPYTFYRRFWVDCKAPNSGGNLEYFLFDYACFWGGLLLLTLIWKGLKTKNPSADEEAA